MRRENVKEPRGVDTLKRRRGGGGYARYLPAIYLHEKLRKNKAFQQHSMHVQEGGVRKYATLSEMVAERRATRPLWWTPEASTITCSLVGSSSASVAKIREPCDRWGSEKEMRGKGGSHAAN